MISQLIWGIMRHHEASNFCVIELPDVLSNGFASEHSRPSKRSLKRKKAAAKKAAAKASEMAQHHWNHCPTSGSPKSNNNQMSGSSFRVLFQFLRSSIFVILCARHVCMPPTPNKNLTEGCQQPGGESAGSISSSYCAHGIHWWDLRQKKAARVRQGLGEIHRRP